MKRRTLLQACASIAAILPFERLRLLAQPRELTPDALRTLHAIGPTVLPQSIGADRIRRTVDGFAAWTAEYREGVPLAHGYGHPRLEKTGESPAGRYMEQLAALDAAARAKGGTWATLDGDARRAILDD